ncbi:MAG TPA: Gfo/Idh/MocA family oxidoreductase [Flavisolibacter sp.]|jgi:predicted dehydrogenase|nr:Gfo/Idh/MocA family oxidoreductase [Flavisolibacter sp.]
MITAQQINWGIIGCGNVTEVKSGPAFNKVPHSRLVAVMRRDGEKARDYARRHGVPRWYDDADQLIADPEVNAVYIATPPSSHEDYTVRALRAGKQVYVEKPMAADAAAAMRMQEAARSGGQKLCVAHYRRWQPLFLKILFLLKEKAIGKVQLVNLQCLQPYQTPLIAKTAVNWRLDPSVSGGGLFHDLAPHQLDLMLYFFGTAVYAKGTSLNTAGLYQAPDTTAGTLLFENGILFNGIWHFAVPEKRDRCEIIGTEGTIRFSFFDHKPVEVITETGTTTYEFEKLEHVQQPMIERVVRYFRNECENPCPAEDGVQVMKWIDAFAGSPL